MFQSVVQGLRFVLFALSQYIPVGVDTFRKPCGMKVLQALPERHPEYFIFCPSRSTSNGKNHGRGQGWVGAFGLSFSSSRGRAEAAMTAARSPAKLAATLDMSEGEMSMQNSVTFLLT